MAVEGQDQIQRINRDAYADSGAAYSYSRAEGLFPSEAVILDGIRNELRGGKTLDLGVGGGRTTGPLLEISQDYIGIDSSEAMISVSRKRFPNARFILGNASDLSDFRDAEFALVMFSFNGIDSVGHERRIEILREVGRVLRKGGYFVFSSHNRSLDRYDEFPLPIPPLSWNPLRSARDAWVFLSGMIRHWRLRRLETRQEDYAIINEPDNGYSLMNYYVTIPEQTRRLREAGFQGPIRAFDLRGLEIAENNSDRSLYYCAKK